MPVYAFIHPPSVSIVDIEYIPRREPAKAAPVRVQLIFLWFIVISERKMEFQFCDGNSPKKIGKKPLLCGWWVGGGLWVDGGQK